MKSVDWRGESSGESFDVVRDAQRHGVSKSVIEKREKERKV